MFGVGNEFLLAVFAIFFTAGVVKGILGFGLPIISMSLLPFVMPVEKAIVLSAFVQPATNVFQLISAGGLRSSLKLTWIVLAALVPGILIGSWFLTSLDSQTLLVLVGVTIFGYASLDLSGYRIRFIARYPASSGIGFGVVAGIVGALTALNGWAFIMYLVGLDVERRVFRSAVALLFLVSGLLISSSFWAIGWLTSETALFGLLALAAAFPGMSVGNRLGEKLSGDLFRKWVLIALLIVGCFMMVRGLLA